jgi:hypothetical protein
MKLYKNAIIVIAVLGVLVAAYLLFKDKIGGSNDDYSNRDITRIIDISTSDMVEMTMQTSDGTFVFKQETVKEDDREVKKWLLVSPEGLKYDESKVNSVAINFSSIIADKVIEEEAKDLRVYGLDNPAVVSARLADGTEKAIEIGDLTPTKGGYYVKEKGVNKVYTMGSYSGEKLKVSKNDLRDKTLFTFAAEDIIKLTMERNGKTVFEAQKEGEYDWTLITPIKGTANASAISPMQEAVAALSVSEFVEENPADFGIYGLANPAYVLEAETAEKDVGIMLGSEMEDGSKFYAKTTESDEVFTVSSEPFNFLDKPIEEIVEVFAYIVNIKDINKIVVEMDGRVDTINIQTDEEDSDKDVFHFNGMDVSALKDEKDSQLIRKYYQALIGVTLAKVDASAEPEGEAEITFTYYLKKVPGTMKVEFVPKDERMYYVFRNGEYTGILVEKEKFDEPEGVRDMYGKLKEVMNK